MDELATWFGPDQRPLFGVVTLPDGPTDLGVVLCPPMTEEARLAHRTFRTLARSLATAGVASIRFDYHGTGDSAGLLIDDGLADEWVTDVGTAIDLLRRNGAGRVAVVGMRFGATLAAIAATTTPVDALVLWDPCSSGQRFLRESQALHSMRTDPTATFEYAVPDGAVDTPGFLFGPKLVDEMRPLNLNVLSTADPLPRRTLVLTRDDRPVPADLRRSLTFDGVEWDQATGQAELLDSSTIDSEVPRQTVDRVTKWLAALPGGEPTTAVTYTARPVSEVATTSSAGRVTERIGTYGAVGLIGIETAVSDAGRPASRAADSPPPWLVFLNVAREHHIGPSRQWVELSREWAQLGFRCVRLDLSGIGDSPVRPGQAEDIIFAGEWLEDVPAVVRELSADGSDVVLVGLCSGGQLGMEAALVSDVAAVLAVNVKLSEPRMSRGGDLYDPRRIVAKPPIRPLGTLARRNRVVGGGLWRIYRQFAVWNAPMAGVAQVVRTGTELLMLANPFDASEYREVAFWTLFRVPFLRRNPRYRMVLREEIDHSMLTQPAQQTVRSLFTDYLVGRYLRDA